MEKFDFVYAVHPESGARTPRGFAFVTYELPEGAAKAIKHLDGKTVNGQRMRARPANSSNPSSALAADRKRKLLVADGAAVSSSGRQMSKEEKIRAMEAKLKALESGDDPTFKLAVSKR